MIALAEPTLGGNERQYIMDCLDSGFVSSTGPFVDRFEREFAAAVGARHAVACASGTGALHVALRLAGARPGSLVAVSDFTFIASANAIRYTGADLLLVDSERDTWNMDTELLRDEVVRRANQGQRIPDVVEVVHVLGHPADVEPLLELRDRFGVRIIEDAAESLGASWCSGRLASQQVGTVGLAGCFSFNGNKIITSGGGGMIVTSDAEFAAKAKHLTTQAKVAGSDYVHDTVGYNYRLTNLAAALGVAQLERLSSCLAAKRQIADHYTRWLAGLPVATAPRACWANPTYWLYSLLLTDPATNVEHIAAGLADHGIQARRLWPPLHRQRPYASTERLNGQIADEIHRRGLSLPSSAHVTKSDQRAVTSMLAKLLA